MRLLCAGYQISQKQQLLEQKGGWAAAGGWQPGLVLTMSTSLSGAAGWLGMLMGPRGDQFVHSPQARGDKTFPFLREEAQQGHDQDWGTAGWQVLGLENTELKAQLGAACSTVSHIQDRRPPPPLPSYSSAPYTAQSPLSPACPGSGAALKQALPLALCPGLC